MIVQKLLFVLIVVFYLIIDNSFAQRSEGSQSKFSGIKLGYSNNELLEGSLNRVIHGGSGFLAGWFSEKQNGRTVKGFEFQLATNMLKSSYESESASINFNLPLYYHYLFNLHNPNPSTDLYMGGFAGMDFNIEYFDNWNENHFYWLTSYSLGPDFRFDHFFSQKHKLQIEGKLPFISLVSRPPSRFMNIQSKSGFIDVARKIHENSRLALIDKHFEFNILISFSLFRSEKVHSNIFWQIHYLNNKIEGSGQIKMVNQSFGIELCF